MGGLEWGTLTVHFWGVDFERAPVGLQGFEAIHVAVRHHAEFFGVSVLRGPCRFTALGDVFAGWGPP